MTAATRPTADHHREGLRLRMQPRTLAQVEQLDALIAEGLSGAALCDALGVDQPTLRRLRKARDRVQFRRSAGPQAVHPPPPGVLRLIEAAGDRIVQMIDDRHTVAEIADRIGTSESQTGRAVSHLRRIGRLPEIDQSRISARGWQTRCETLQAPRVTVTGTVRGCRTEVTADSEAQARHLLAAMAAPPPSHLPPDWRRKIPRAPGKRADSLPPLNRISAKAARQWAPAAKETSA
jgi:hypothetical protein